MKRPLAILLAFLQAVQASAGYVVQVQVQAPVGGVGVAPVPGGAIAPLAAQPGALGASLAVPSGAALVLPALPSVAAPAPQVRTAAASAAQAAVAAPTIRAAAAVPSALARPMLAAPQARVETASPILRAALQGAAPAAPGTQAEAGDPVKALGLPALTRDVPVEASKTDADESFAALLGQRLVRGQGETAGPAVSAMEDISGRLRTTLAAPAAGARVAAVRPEPSAPAAVPAAVSFWSKPAVRRTALAAGLAALPFLAPYTSIVAAAGSLTLGVIGIPQIIKNAQAGREGTKDLTVASPLIWFAAAVLLSAVSIGQGSSLWWNAVNLAGVAESAAVVGQLLWYKRDAAANKKAALTAAAVLTPLPLMAMHLLLPASAWLSAAFTTAMGLLWVLNWPQVRQNNALWRAEHRAPQGIAPLYPILVVAGSLLHLYAAIMGGDLRWALNAIIAVVTTSMVLGQLYAPRATNALLGPLVRASDWVTGLLSRGRGAETKGRSASLAEARAALAEVFDGADLAGFEGRDSQVRLAEAVERAKALPGHSAIFLEAPTAAGKSTLAKSLEQALGTRIRSLEVDRYFKTRKDVPLDAQGQPDFDRPDSLLLGRVAADIRTLLAGGRVELPVHDMATGTTRFDSGEFMQLAPGEVLVVDSIYASHASLLEAARGRPSLNIYLDAPAAVRLERRLARDKVARGKPVLDNLKGWAQILANEREHIRPLAARADLTLNLVGAEELARLQDAYAGLLADEWALNGRDAAATSLFIEMVRASLRADGAYAVPVR